MRTLPTCALIALAACSSHGSDTGSTAAPMAPPAIGMQLTTTSVKVAAGQEEYQCWSFKVPDGQPISLVGLENQIPTVGVHHWAVFTNSDPMTSTGPYECATMGVSWGLVSGGGLGTPGVKFPDGTAMTLAGGQHLIFQLHLLNAGVSDVDVQPAYINLNGTTQQGLQPVGLLIAGTLDITIPAHKTGVDVTGGCELKEPLEHVFSVFPHMHQYGQSISAEIVPAGGAATTKLADVKWGFADQRLYPATGAAAVGDRVKVTCRYDNPGDTDVHFGLSTHDEMCIDVLYYYPAKTPSKYCGLDD